MAGSSTREEGGISHEEEIKVMTQRSIPRTAVRGKTMAPECLPSQSLKNGGGVARKFSLTLPSLHEDDDYNKEEEVGEENDEYNLDFLFNGGGVSRIEESEMVTQRSCPSSAVGGKTMDAECLHSQSLGNGAAARKLSLTLPSLDEEEGYNDDSEEHESDIDYGLESFFEVVTFPSLMWNSRFGDTDDVEAREEENDEEIDEYNLGFLFNGSVEEMDFLVNCSMERGRTPSTEHQPKYDSEDEEEENLEEADRSDGQSAPGIAGCTSDSSERNSSSASDSSERNSSSEGDMRRRDERNEPYDVDESSDSSEQAIASVLRLRSAALPPVSPQGKMQQPRKARVRSHHAACRSGLGTPESFAQPELSATNGGDNGLRSSVPGKLRRNGGAGGVWEACMKPPPSPQTPLDLFPDTEEGVPSPSGVKALNSRPAGPGLSFGDDTDRRVNERRLSPYPKSTPFDSVAYVALLMGSSDYYKGVVAVVKSLRAVGSRVKLIVAVRSDVPEAHREILKEHGCDIREVEIIESPRPRGGKAQVFAVSYYAWNYTKLQIFGFDEYQRLIYLDGDMLLLQNLDHLFWEPLPIDGAGRVGIAGVKDCFCEGETHPRERRGEGYCQVDPDTHPWTLELPLPAPYINAGFFVFEPSKAVLQDMCSQLQKYEPTPLAEQDFLNDYFCRRIKILPNEYNVLMPLLYNHPTRVNLDEAKLIHFSVTGSKPWRFDPREKNMDHKAIQQLVACWWEVYCTDMKSILQAAAAEPLPWSSPDDDDDDNDTSNCGVNNSGLRIRADFDCEQHKVCFPEVELDRSDMEKLDTVFKLTGRPGISRNGSDGCSTTVQS
ncbi:hypothetical protein CBR_g31702 [Chara braunii]|uniref:Uncharacterized protein n=1 Tax=Chara braunii TaxID=69332 RepID=A0A388JY36_CHABU|nr:hypothetical protein CBR_g31702 [Chara braunii]|eukprot:GBG62685.1 hypothetical protein CBR_g31702 [Chara braunii]